MSKKQSDSLKARIQTVPILAAKTFKSIAQYPAPNELVKVEPPYCVIHGSDGVDTQERLTAGRVTMHPRFTLHITGNNVDQVETITGLLKNVFIANGLGIPLTVAGETCSGLWWSAPEVTQVDSDPLPQLPYAIVEIGWNADPV